MKTKMRGNKNIKPMTDSEQYKHRNIMMTNNTANTSKDTHEGHLMMWIKSM
jgi:hypothetical protein